MRRFGIVIETEKTYRDHFFKEYNDHVAESRKIVRKLTEDNQKQTVEIERLTASIIKRDLKIFPRIREVTVSLREVLEAIRNTDLDIQYKASVSQPLFRKVLDPLEKLEDDVQKTGREGLGVKKA